MSLEPSDEANVVGDFAETARLKPMWAIVNNHGLLSFVHRQQGKHLMLFDTPLQAVVALREMTRGMLDSEGAPIPGETVGRIVPLYLGRGPSVALRQCPDCRGDGFAWCPLCHGDGSSMNTGRTCGACGGSGAHYCPPCDGTGWMLPEALQTDADTDTSDEEVLP